MGRNGHPPDPHEALAAQRQVNAQLDAARRERDESAAKHNRRVAELKRQAAEAQVQANEALAASSSEWLNSEEAAAYLKVTRAALRDAVHQGKVRSYGGGRSRRFCRSELDEDIRSGRFSTPRT